MAQNVDSRLTALVKNFALNDLNADLVGVANIERFEHAPLKMSPQGLLPSARSVVVMAIHHTDAAIEMGGREHPQLIGPYRLQYQMNSRLDEMSYRLAMWLESKGFAAVGIVSSNIWRYKGYKDLDAHFAPDLSHLHAAVAAGLSEFGFNGLSITPEYGARQRYVTVVTDAELTPTPLLEPGTVCDNCMLCAKHCMSEALVKELDGFKEVPIEDKVYRYADKNLWRCAWGEHFDLDLDLPKPDHIDEAVIIEQVKQHGLRGGEMGSCLRYCVPRGKRYFDKDYTNAPRRRRLTADADKPVDRGVFEQLRAIAVRWDLDACVSLDADALAAAGTGEIGTLLPDARSAFCFVLKSALDSPAAPGFETAADRSYADQRLGGSERYRLVQAAYDAARLLQSAGYSALCESGIDEAKIAAAIGKASSCGAGSLCVQSVLCSAALPVTDLNVGDLKAPRLAGSALKAALAEAFRENIDGLFGVASASMLNETASQLADIYEGREYFIARDRTIRFHATDMAAESATMKIYAPADRLAAARSVIVLGVPLSASAVDITARTPAEAVGPHTFTSYESLNRACEAAGRLAGRLRAMGYQARMTTDLCGTGSMTASPRGLLSDMFCNRFAAVAAGLARLGTGGFPIAERFGANVRFVAVVTDAEMPCDAPAGETPPERCDNCEACVGACRTAAHGDMLEVSVGGAVQRYRDISRARCDWAKRYSLIADEGCRYTAWTLDVPAPETIEADSLREALNRQDTILKHRPCNFELCMMSCPYVRPQ